MIWLRLEALAETPIALPRRGQAGNLYETLPEIPGTAVRGAFAGKYIRAQGWDGCVPDNGEKLFRQLFENHSVRFGPLRPLPDDLACQWPLGPVVPVPRSASSCKYDGGLTKGHRVFDSLLRQGQETDGQKDDDPRKRKCPEPRCQAPLEPLDSTWLVARWNPDLQGGRGHDYDPVPRLNTHVGIAAVEDNAAGMAEEARLFSLQHFPAGTRFRGWIAVADGAPDPLADPSLQKVMEDNSIILRVGRRRNSYGALRVWIVKEASDDFWAASHQALSERWNGFQTEQRKESFRAKPDAGKEDLRPNQVPPASVTSTSSASPASPT